MQEYERTLSKGAKDPLYASLEKEIGNGEEAIQDLRKNLREDVRKDLDERQKAESKAELEKLRTILEERLRRRAAAPRHGNKPS